ncbi:potassium channel subfamily K member 18-like [Ptychodera flava]|uniref:potassium channel subfamily K member 18-like n=1 Tax=Ptychodera flava TaxID=63121 RepID=UPI00396A5579
MPGRGDGHDGDESSNESCPGCSTNTVYGSVLLAVIVVLYLLLGAVIFKGLEEDHAASAHEKLKKEKGDILAGLMRDLNITSHKSHLAIVRSYLRRYERSLLKASCRGSQGLSDDWSYGRAFMFSLTTISTIGYGNVTPVTTKGRLFCIFYSIFGIPLFLLFLSYYGSLFVKAVSQCKQWATKERRTTLSGHDIAETGDLAEGANGSSIDWTFLRNVRNKITLQTQNDRNEGQLDSNVDENVTPLTASADDTDQFDVSAVTQGYLKMDENKNENEALVKPEGLSYEQTMAAFDDVNHKPPHETSVEHTAQHENLPLSSLPYWVLPFILIIYIAATSIGIYYSEPGWGVVDSIYFCVITFTTIGYGDLELTINNTFFQRCQYMRPLLTSVFITIGLLLLSACFNLAQKQIATCARCIVCRLENCSLCKEGRKN